MNKADFLKPGENCWKIATADRLSYIVDAADYFHVAKQAMAAAKHCVYLIGWDFDLKIRLTPGEPAGELPDELGDFLSHIVNQSEGLQVHVLQWDGAMLLNLSRQLGSFIGLKIRNDSRVQFRLDREHPAGACHHQKIVVIDDALAFCGGIDMTTGRWDTSAHESGDDLRRSPAGDAYGPWHDLTLAVDGDAARCLGELARDRWHRATGKSLPTPPSRGSIWPEALPVWGSKVEVGIARTMPPQRDNICINEIEQLWRDIIADASRTIYIENQFLSSAVIADALEERLTETGGPQIVIVLPMQADMLPEREVMDNARALIVERLRLADHEDGLRVLYPVNDEGKPVYVHAKLIIADDSIVKIGSSNMSNRSLRLDSECDIVVATSADDPHRETAARLRDQLVGEHLGVSGQFISQMLAANGQDLIKVIDDVGYRTFPGLRALAPGKLQPAEKSLAESNLMDPEHPTKPVARLLRLGGDLFLRRPGTCAAFAVGFACIALAAFRHHIR